MKNNELQISQHNDTKEQLKLAQYQLSKVTKERDALKLSISKETANDFQKDAINHKKFESVYNKWKQTLEQNKDLKFCNLIKNDFSPIKNYEEDYNIRREKGKVNPDINDNISDKVFSLLLPIYLK